MRINPGIHHKVEARVNLFVRAVATGAAIGVMMAAFYTFASIQSSEDCANGIDDDLDGWVDLADSDCTCTGSPVASFTQGGEAIYQGNQGCKEIYRMTTDGSKKAGAILLDDEIDFSDTVDLTCALQFGRFDRGGLGISFMLFPGELETTDYGVTDGEQFIHTDPSLIIEFDTDDNGNSEDIEDDHLSIFLNGDLTTPVLGPTSLETDVEDDQDHFFRLVWLPDDQTLEIYFDDMLTPLASYKSDIVDEIFEGNESIKLASMAFTGLSNNTNQQNVELLNLSYESTLGVILPVEWGEFSLVQNQEAALLTWKTQSESHSSYFEVQRSDDQQVFRPLARLDAAGNSTTPSRYHFKDEALPIGESNRVYYRVKQVDLNGEVAFSQVLELPIKELDQNLSIDASPNPATNRLKLAMTALGPAELKIMNTSGQILETKQLELKPASSLDLDVSTWSQGLYIFQLRASGKTASTGVWVR